MQIRPVDATDPDTFAAWHATYDAAHVHGLDHASPKRLEELRADLAGDRVGERLEAYGGYVDGRCVVTGLVWLPLMDNLHLASVDVATHPSSRRRGHGSAMLAHLTAVARAVARTVLTAEVVSPYDGPADGAGWPGADFLTRHGFTFSLGDVKRALDLPVDADVLAGLAQEAAPRHRDYRLRFFVGPVPDDIVTEFGSLVGSLMTEAPMGDLEREPEVLDTARIRADEAVFALAGRTKYTTVAVAPDGRLAAYSEIVVPAHDPGRFYQWGTLVRPEHRGHRLGLATKVHNLQRLQEDLSSTGLLYTYNAEVNHHMIAVNEALGFRPVGRLGEFQKRL